MRGMTMVVVVSLLGWGCGSEPEVEKVPVGADVQLTRQDGGVVAGKLTERDEKAVKVQTGKTSRTVPKDQIADVKVVEPGSTKAPELPPVAKFREITVPDGTKLVLELETALNTKTAVVEDSVQARLTEAVSVDGVEVLPVGTRLSGTVSSVQAAGKVKGVASIAVRFTRLTARDENYTILSDFTLTAPSSKKKDAAKIGIGAAAGAVIGAIAGGGKGAAIGAAVGGGAGTGYVMMTAGEEIDIPKGAKVDVSLDRAVDIRVPINR
jgi:hypothetical protein